MEHRRLLPERPDTVTVCDITLFYVLFCFLFFFWLLLFLSSSTAIMEPNAGLKLTTLRSRLELI